MIGRSELMELLEVERAAPCVSIYMRMQRRFPEQAQNEVRFRNLLKQVEDAERRPDLPPPGDECSLRCARCSTAKNRGRIRRKAWRCSPRPATSAVWLPRAVPERVCRRDRRYHIKPVLASCSRRTATRCSR